MKNGQRTIFEDVVKFIRNRQELAQFARRPQGMTPEGINALLEAVEFGTEYGALADGLENHKIKRWSFDSNVSKLISSTTFIDTEELITQLRHVSFPYDEMLICGPTGSTNQLCFWVRACNELKSFSFRLILKARIDDTPFGMSTKDLNEIGKKMAGFLDGNIYYGNLISPYISHEEICIDDRRFFNPATTWPSTSIINGNPATNINDQAKAIDNSFYPDQIDLYAVSDFMIRLLVILTSDKISTNFNAPNDLLGEEDLIRKNKERKKLKRPALLPDRPIIVDPTVVNNFTLQKDPKKIRTLLGWTSVRRSKPIPYKNRPSEFFTRKPHDRRIPANVDRRNALREITARLPANLVVTEDRPQIVISSALAKTKDPQ